MSLQAQYKYLFPTLFNDDGNGFAVIAHRGASAYYPENTMPAFEAAVKMGAEMIELDVMLSKDGVPMVFHDAKLNDHTNGRGTLSDYTLAELKALDAGSWFDSKFAGTRIPTLEEVLQFSQNTIALNIEIKTETVTDELRGGVEEKCLQLVEKYGMSEHVMFSSFDYRAVEHFKKIRSKIPVALLFERQQSAGRTPSELVAYYEADAFNCSYGQLTKARLYDLKTNSIPVFVYTVDKAKHMKWWIGKGVAGIFSNKPDLLQSVVAEMT